MFNPYVTINENSVKIFYKAIFLKKCVVRKFITSKSQ